MGKVSKWAKENRKFLLKSAVFAGASFLDYYLTDLGISKGRIEEINPVVNYFIELYGNAGPYLIKGATAAGGVAAMYLADKFKDKTRIKSDHIFYDGTGIHVAAASAAAYCILY